MGTFYFSEGREWGHSTFQRHRDRGMSPFTFMATVIRRCGHCRKVIEVTGNYLGIGIPFTLCRSCGGINRITHLNEWALKSAPSKIWYYFILTWTVISYSVSGPLLIELLSRLTANPFSKSTYFASYLLAAIFFALLTARLHQKDVAAPNRRLQDPQYVGTLQTLGFLKPSQATFTFVSARTESKGINVGTPPRPSSHTKSGAMKRGRTHPKH